MSFIGNDTLKVNYTKYAHFLKKSICTYVFNNELC